MHLMSALSGVGVIALVMVGLLVVDALQRHLGPGTKA